MDFRIGGIIITREKITQNRLSSILQKQLYKMADNENTNEYESLELKWTLPINSTEGMISVLQNIVFLLGYVQKHKCNRDYIDKIIENDLQPVISGLKDEFDFMFACIIIAVCGMTENFCDKETLMELARNVMGQFLNALEVCVKEFYDLEEHCTNKSAYTHSVDTSGFAVGMVIKNYKELCNLLGQEVKSGKSKKLQLEDFKRYFDWEKSGQKFIITDIYDTPLTKEDRRKLGNNSIYVKYIELILLQYLSKQEGYTKTFTKRNWWELLGMVNRKYNKISKKQLENIDYTITSYQINHFYQRCNKKLEQILFSALNNLKNRKLIIWEMQTVVVAINENGKEVYFLADDEDKKKILQVERYVLKNVMGYEKMIQVFCRFRQNEYYQQVNEKLNELYGWDHYFKQIKLIYTPEDVLEAIQQSEIDLQKEILNEKIINVLNENAKEKYDTEIKKWEETCRNLIWGDYKHDTKSGTWKIPDTYLEAQRILTDELINIGHKKNRISLEQFEEEEELNQLFTSFMC
ncbi:hypothetical protein I6E50_07485 [Roseburia hominis]|uniref:hypothetical protein n=1 Tax=Roseburia hominis TaxID=301301 RepID=UPI001F175F43|nr:hypothetical protein [Roseburia hominis]